MMSMINHPGFCAVALGQGLLMGPAAQDDQWHDDGAGWGLDEEESNRIFMNGAESIGNEAATRPAD